MDKEQFLEQLNILGLNKKEFSNISKVPYSTINNWGTIVNGKPLVIPSWVEPLLYYYERARNLEYLTDEICSKIRDDRKNK
jgi:hypothetical protein